MVEGATNTTAEGDAGDSAAAVGFSAADGETWLAAAARCWRRSSAHALRFCGLRAGAYDLGSAITADTGCASQGSVLFVVADAPATAVTTSDAGVSVLTVARGSPGRGACSPTGFEPSEAAEPYSAANVRTVLARAESVGNGCTGGTAKSAPMAAPQSSPIESRAPARVRVALRRSCAARRALRRSFCTVSSDKRRTNATVSARPAR